MDTSNWVFLDIYVDQDVDAILRARAASEDVSKGAMFRRFVAAGIARVDAGEMPVRLCDRDRLCMRSVFLPPELIGRVSEFSFAFRLGRREVLRQLVRLGADENASIGRRKKAAARGPDRLRARRVLRGTT